MDCGLVATEAATSVAAGAGAGSCRSFWSLSVGKGKREMEGDIVEDGEVGSGGTARRGRVVYIRLESTEDWLSEVGRNVETVIHTVVA